MAWEDTYVNIINLLYHKIIVVVVVMLYKNKIK